MTEAVKTSEPTVEELVERIPDDVEREHARQRVIEAKGAVSGFDVASANNEVEAEEMVESYRVHAQRLRDRFDSLDRVPEDGVTSERPRWELLVQLEWSNQAISAWKARAEFFRQDAYNQAHPAPPPPTLEQRVAEAEEKLAQLLAAQKPSEQV
jgi:hypothetical protein